MKLILHLANQRCEGLSAQDGEGSRLQRERTLMFENAPRLFLSGRVQYTNPSDITVAGAELKRNRFVGGVQKDGQSIANDSLAAPIGFLDLVPHQAHPEVPRMSRIPICVAHLIAIGFEPIDIFDVLPIDGPALEKVASPKDRLALTEPDHLADKLEEIPLLRGEIPVQPGDG